MEKHFKYLTLLLVAAFIPTLSSCGGDDDDEPGGSNSTITTEYGAVKTTGVKTISLFTSASDGETTLNIPGFAPIRAKGSYNIYKHYVDNIGLYAEDDGNEFASWIPGGSIPASFTDLTYSHNILVRTKVKNSDAYVYAYIEKVRPLEAGTGTMGANLIGYVYKYTSPIDPHTFTGISSN